MNHIRKQRDSEMWQMWQKSVSKTHHTKVSKDIASNIADVQIQLYTAGRAADESVFTSNTELF